MNVKTLRLGLISGLCSMFLLASCDKEISLQAPGEREGQGEVQDFSIESNARVALYSDQALQKGEHPELVYGNMDLHLVTIDGVTYIVDWNDLEDFKNLKKGEKLHFRGNDYIAHIEKQEKNYRVIRLNEL